ncbi:MAG: inositol monophosphatase family protein [Rhodospirillales bacterium]
MIIDSDKVVALLQQVAAEEVMPLWQNLGEGDISYKDGVEPVTVADRASEAALARGLLDLLPGAQVVGEEGVSEDPRRMGLLQGDDWVWVIDPIDGTGNFSKGRPHFALMVALVRDGETQGAWILAPALERLAVAWRGEGVSLDGRARRIAANDRPPAELSGTLHAGQFAPKDMAQLIKSRRERVRAIRSLGSAGIEYLRLLDGEMEFSFFTKLKPWDHAPGCLLLGEAGAVTRFTDSGDDYSPLRHEGQGLLIAPNARAWASLHRALLASDPD